ncbi:MAG: hypothetical protein AMJ56_13160 [Anaerolineae bacterium SG8_19]|nr:MAG: hypothetical protein AMJ56_13160 [Anaerolineae bacterium SG8_19]HCB49761.1 hypothetical protein [Chloroflexota bacterium]
MPRRDKNHLLPHFAGGEFSYEHGRQDHRGDQTDSDMSFNFSCLAFLDGFYWFNRGSIINKTNKIKALIVNDFVYFLHDLANSRRISQIK